MPAEALSGQVMLGSCRRSAAAAWRALAGRLAPSAATAGDPLLASGRRTHRLDRSAWLSVTAAAAGEWRRQAAAAGGAAAASPAAVAGHPAHSSAPHQQQAVQQAELAHLRQLSEEQLAAVTAPLGTLRVVAGPGSGKTRVLTHRIAHLIRVHGAQPWQVLAITFTNKAANEMKERLSGMLGAEAAGQLFAGTFHSLCYRLLKQHIGELAGSGRTQAFTVFDQDMSRRLLAQLVRAEQPEWKGRAVTEKADYLQHEISSVKNSMLTWHASSAQAVERLVERHLARQRNGEVLSAQEEQREREVVEWFGRYEHALRQNNALDFDDLLGQTVALLRSAPAVRERYLRRFRHVCVDEFQDTNTSQYELVKLLTLPRADLFVVGDPDQSIYGWRGADMTNMTHAFSRDYPQAQIFALRDNYRSCARIVATAERVIAANDDWERAGLRPKRPAGHPIEVHMLRDSYDEARHIASDIQQALRSGEHPEEQIAVLFRTHIQARLVEQELVLRNIPYVLVGGVPFWRRVEIQDVMAYLRLAVSLQDNVALGRIINTPRRGLGDTSIEKLHAAAVARGLNLSAFLFGDAATGGGSAGLPPLPDRAELGLTAKAAAALEAFRELMLGLHGAVASQPLGRALQAIIDKTGYEKHVRDGGCSSSGKEGDEEERLQRLAQLLAAAAEYEPGKLSGAAALDAAFDGPAASARVQSAAAAAAGVAAAASAAGSGAGGTPLQRAQNFLDEAALYSAVDEGGEGAPGVRLMTMHSAKGLEFELVFIPGCNDGLVPLIRKNDKTSSLSEERRLFYVSLTRAKQRLRLSHTRESNHYGSSGGDTQEPSRFLMDVVRAGHAVVRGAGSAQPAPSRRRRSHTPSWDSSDEDDYGEPDGGVRITVSAVSRDSRARRGSSSSGSGSSGTAAQRAQQSAARRSGSRPGQTGAAGGGAGGIGAGGSGSLMPPRGGSTAQRSSPPPPLSAAQQKAQKRGGRR